MCEKSYTNKIVRSSKKEQILENYLIEGNMCEKLYANK